jgi:hypothetical protein
MTARVQVIPDPVEFVEQFGQWLADPQCTDDPSVMLRTFEDFGSRFIEYADAYTELAAWCRLAVGLLRGEDVPQSIHAPEDEDPTDTARWQKWRLS